MSYVGDRHLSIRSRDEVPQFSTIRELESSCLRVALVRTALELGVFDAVAEGVATDEALARSLSIDARSATIVLDALCTQGFLEKEGPDYRLDPAAATYLVRGRESYYGRSLLELTLSLDVAQRMSETVRSGVPVPRTDTAQGSGGLWAADLAPMLTLWPVKADEARAMWQRIGLGDWPNATILDVACGAGIDIFTFLHDNPNSRGVAMDLHPEVLDMARRVSRLMGVEERVKFATGDILKSDFGGEIFDVAFLSSILYFFDHDQVESVFRRAHAALKKGGTIVVHHLLPDEERRVRPAPALLALQLLLFHPRSRVFTASEYASMLYAANFCDVQSDGEDLVWAVRT
jgi:C-methyltransferase